MMPQSNESNYLLKDKTYYIFLEYSIFGLVDGEPPVLPFLSYNTYKFEKAKA